MGVARIFQSGGGGGERVTLCQSESTHQIVMAFSPSAVGCLLKKRLTKGEVTGTPEPPGYALGICNKFVKSAFLSLS